MDRYVDKIIFNNLKTYCIIGTLKRERFKKQKLIFNIELFLDFNDLELNDDISNTVDYKKLAQKILSFVKEKNFYLIETVALQVAQLCLQYSDKIKKVKVRIDKPLALKKIAASAAVEIIRSR